MQPSSSSSPFSFPTFIRRKIPVKLMIKYVKLESSSFKVENVMNTAILFSEAIETFFNDDCQLNP